MGKCPLIDLLFANEKTFQVGNWAAFMFLIRIACTRFIHIGIFSLLCLHWKVIEDVNTGVYQLKHLNPATLDSKTILLSAQLHFFLLTFTVKHGPEEMGPAGSKGCSTSLALCSPQLRLCPVFSRFPDQKHLLHCTYLSN